MADEPVGRQLGPGHKVVPASLVQDSPYTCPHCKSTNVIISGYFKRAFEQEHKDGKPIAATLAMGAEALQEIEAMVCRDCKIHTIIEDNVVYDREGLIFDLQLTIATLQGKVPVNSQGKEWKQ